MITIESTQAAATIGDRGEPGHNRAGRMTRIEPGGERNAGGKPAETPWKRPNLATLGRVVVTPRTDRFNDRFFDGCERSRVIYGNPWSFFQF